jgi:imidazole glycerol phosphate synthase subunit HisF
MFGVDGKIRVLMLYYRAKEVEKRRAGELLVTSLDADGTQAGYDLSLTKAIAERVEIPVIASGGAGNCQHLYRSIDGRAGRSGFIGFFAAIMVN